MAVSEGPKCAEAHYNLGNTLWYLGEKEEARTHLLKAADLAPGNAAIWDSPVLRPYGEPQKDTKNKKATASEQAPGASGNRGRLGGYLGSSPSTIRAGFWSPPCRALSLP